LRISWIGNPAAIIAAINDPVADIRPHDARLSWILIRPPFEAVGRTADQPRPPLFGQVQQPFIGRYRKPLFLAESYDGRFRPTACLTAKRPSERADLFAAVKDGLPIRGEENRSQIDPGKREIFQFAFGFGIPNSQTAILACQKKSAIRAASDGRS